MRGNKGAINTADVLGLWQHCNDIVLFVGEEKTCQWILLDPNPQFLSEMPTQMILFSRSPSFIITPQGQKSQVLQFCVFHHRIFQQLS